jgi:hypothetical protein
MEASVLNKKEIIFAFAEVRHLSRSSPKLFNFEFHRSTNVSYSVMKIWRQVSWFTNISLSVTHACVMLFLISVNSIIKYFTDNSIGALDRHHAGSKLSLYTVDLRIA